MSIHIKKVIIDNFRCFNHVELDVEQFTVLVGENACGKTSILEAISLALSRRISTSRIAEQDFNMSDDGDIGIEVIFDGSFDATLADGYTTQVVPCDRVRVTIKRRERAAPGRAMNDGFVINHIVVPDATVRQTSSGWSIKRKGGTDFQISERSLAIQSVEAPDLPRCFFFDRQRERQSSVGFNSTMSRLVDDRNWRFMNGMDETARASYVDQWEEVYATILSAANSMKFRETVIEIQSRLVKMLGTEYKALELSLLDLEQPFSKSFFALRFGHNQVAQDGLGSGVSLIISYLLLEAISTMSKEQLVILIDEPELHLHPQLQSQFCSHLREAKFDVIMSTHAASMVNFSDWRSVKRLGPNGVCHPTDASLSLDLPQNGTPKRIEDHLEDIRKFRQEETVFFREAKDLLFARGCILVEGPVDKYAIEVLAKRHGLDLRDLTIVSCNGKNKIPHHQILCHAFGIPFFTVLDSDLNNLDPSDPISLGAMPGNLFAFSNSMEDALGGGAGRNKTVNAMKAVDEYMIVVPEITDLFDALKRFAVGVAANLSPTTLKVTVPSGTVKLRLDGKSISETHSDVS